MNAIAHTPGPWRHDRRDILTLDTRCIAELFSGPCASLDEADANGRLIAAAPDLLRVARLALEELALFPAIRHTKTLRDDLARVIAAATGIAAIEQTGSAA